MAASPSVAQKISLAVNAPLLLAERVVLVVGLLTGHAPTQAIPREQLLALLAGVPELDAAQAFVDAERRGLIPRVQATPPRVIIPPHTGGSGG